MITRRRIVIALGAAAFAPFAGFAQTRPRLIGWLSRGDPADPVDLRYLDAFKTGMRELGHVEGRDYRVESRFGQGDLSRLPALAAELVALKVDLIVALTTPAAVAARTATREIPIIADSGDPVGTGLAASLSHPGGNITGLSNLSDELYAKRLDLLRQILPGMRRAGFLYNPDNPIDRRSLKQFESACDKLNINSIRAPARNGEEITSAFQTLSREKAQGLIVVSASMYRLRGKIIEHAAKNHLPAIYARNVFVESGGLITYGTDYPEQYRRFAAYADKIFKGAKPGDLPMEQPTKFEMIINLKTAKALGVKIPDVIMLRADKVIE